MFSLYCSLTLFWTHFTIWRFSAYKFGIVQWIDEIWKLYTHFAYIHCHIHKMLQTYYELNITFGLSDLWSLHILDYLMFGNMCMNCASKHFFIIHRRFKFQNDSTCVQFRVEKKYVFKIIFFVFQLP